MRILYFYPTSYLLFCIVVKFRVLHEAQNIYVMGLSKLWWGVYFNWENDGKQKHLHVGLYYSSPSSNISLL